MNQNASKYLGFVIFLLLLLSGCGGDGNNAGTESENLGGSPPQLASVRALSNHYVEVTFNGSASNEANDPANYVISAPNGSRLQVHEANLNNDGTKAVLSTAAQENVDYLLSSNTDSTSNLRTVSTRIAFVGGSVSFTGSIDIEPFLASAISLSNITVLLTYSERIKEGLEEVLFYRISSPDLDILSAEGSADETTVLLTTEPQEHANYTVRVTNVENVSKRIINPFLSTAGFVGIPPNDNIAPQLLSADSLNDTQVLLSFSEPIDEDGADPLNFVLTPALTVTGVELSEHRTQAVLTTLPQTAGVNYIVTVNNVEDDAENVIDAAANTANFSLNLAGGSDLPGNELPRVTGAASQSNTSVLVAFSKPMADSAIVASNYVIVQESINSEAGALFVVSAAFADSDRTNILLTTLSQNELTYRVTAVSVKDLSGKPLDVARVTGFGQLIDPTSATFPGTPPSGPSLVDFDGDGLLDNEEQKGWTIHISRLTGGTVQQEVTSDPFLVDTDGDGITDFDEKNFLTDPRDSDTDDDNLTDFQELNEIYSNPFDQDTDGDSLADGLEYNFFRISPVLADTDGDQLLDNEEILLANRDPRIADLPSPRIRVGSVNLLLDTRFSFTNEAGEQVTEDKTVETTLTRAEDETFSSSNENSTTNTLEFTEQLESTVSAEVSADDIKIGGSLTATVGSKQGSERGSTFATSEESGRSSEEAYHDSFTTSTTRDIRESITREVIDAAIKVDITIENDNDVPFSISNLELTAQTQNPLNRRKIIPIASMVPENENLDFVNIGALGDPSRGPFVFKSISVFPQQVEELMKNPRGLLVQLANFDITDESGRNFAFISQDVLDRTAGITFDMGDGRTESYRVATSSTHDLITGRPQGITMEYALSVIGLSRYEVIRDGGNGVVETVVSGDDVQVRALSDLIEPGIVVITTGDNGVIDSIAAGDDKIAAPDYDIPLLSATIRDGGNRIADSLAVGDDEQIIAQGEFVFPGQIIINAGADEILATTVAGDDVLIPSHRILTRFRDVELNADEKRFWISYTSENRTGVDLDKQVLRSGEQYDFAYVQDKDNDGVWAREEFMHGSSDLLPNTDGCNLSPAPDPCDNLTDRQEIQDGWRVQLKGSPQANLVYPNPVQGDSDRDTLTDDEERACALDPRQRDTDLDGLTDWEELNGKLLENGDTDGNMVSRDPNTDAIVDTIILQPYDGIPLDQNGDPIAELIPHDAITACNAIGFTGFATDPLDADTDGDLVDDGVELQLGLDPNNASDGALFLDDDGDGVPNKIEQDGFFATVNAVTLTSAFTSNPNNKDTDDDGLPDLLEHFIRSNPLDNDTDGDGITDTNEYKGGGAACVTQTVGEICFAFIDLIENNFLSFVTECDAANECDNTDIEQFLTDIGSAQYGTNLNEKDSDFDGADDAVELAELVLLVNGANITVATPSSDPLDDDTDNDGISDGDEVTDTNGFITNPRDADTDGDGVSDARELELGTDPTNEDKQVTFAYTSIIGHADSGDPGDFVEIQGKWQVIMTLSGVTTSSVLVEMEGGDGCDINENGSDNVITRDPQLSNCTVNNDAKLTVIMRPGDSVNMTTTGNDFEECDGPSCETGGDEDELSHINETFDFDTVVSTTKSVQHKDQDDDLTITTTISVTAEQ